MTYPFKGRFDGNGRLISGINVAVFSDGASDVYAGLFGRIENAEISNIGIVNGSVMTSTSSQYQSSCVGVIAGHAELSTVSNCHSSAIVTVSSSSYDLLYAGGIVGHALSSSITKCSNSGNVTVASYSSHAGGIAGYASSSLLTNCRNAGNIKISAVNDLHAGGIAGYASSPVTNCYNTGSVTVSSSSDLSYAGGIAGHTTSSITDCYNAGTITLLSSYSYAGGIAGQASRASVINCYNIGRVSGSETASYAGGIIGMAYRTPTVLNCHYLAGTLFIGGSLHEDRLCGAGTPIIDGSSNDPARKTDPDQESGEKTESQMRPGLAEAQAAGGGNSIYYTGTSTIASAPVQGWDFVSIWTISPDTNEGYPMLRSFSSMTVRFTEQPKDVKAAAGEKVTLSVLAESFMLPRYQWYVSADNGTTWDEIDGANGTSHTLYTTKSDNGKMFRVSATAPDHEGTTSHSDAATLRVDSYEVSLISGEGYTISPYGGSSSPIDRGGSFTFQFRVNEGYAGTYTVFVNNSEVKLDTNGTYTIANITGDKTVTAQVTLTRVYDVTLTSDNGYTLSPYGGSLSPVERGGSFTFSFTVDEGFTAVSYKVFVNTVEVSLNADGTYTIEDITTAQKVTVEGTFTWNVYDVTLTSGSGYTLIGYGGSSSPVDHGDPFTFQFRMNEGYAGTYKVFVNDAEITLDADGTYTIENITSAQTVTVEGEFEMILGAGKGDPRIGIFIILVGTAVILALYAFIIIRGKERRAKEQ
jgi:hypothetical protein